MKSLTKGNPRRGPSPPGGKPRPSFHRPTPGPASIVDTPSRLDLTWAAQADLSDPSPTLPSRPVLNMNPERQALKSKASSRSSRHRVWNGRAGEVEPADQTPSIGRFD